MGMFDNVTISEDLIEISDIVEPTEKETVEEQSKETDTVKQDNNDNSFEIPDVINDIDEEEEEEILNEEEFTEDTDDGTPPSKTKGSSSSSPFKSFAKALVEEEFLPSFTDDEYNKLLEEFGSEADVLMELSKRSILEEIDSYKSNAEEDYKAFLEARENGYDLSKWGSTYDAKKELSSLTDDMIEDNEDVQKKLIAQDLRNRGFSEEDIEDTLDSYETTGKLLNNAKKSHKSLIKVIEAEEKQFKQQKEAEEKARQEERNNTINSLKKEINSLNEIVPGIKINKQTKDKIFSNITTPVKTGPNGESYNASMAKRAENPLKYAIIEDYLVQMGVFDGQWDKIMTRQKSKALSELQKSLSDNKNTSFKTGKNTLSKGSSDDDIEFSLPKF